MKKTRKAHLAAGVTAGVLAYGGLFGAPDVLAAASDAELEQLKQQVEQLVRQNQALSQRVTELEKQQGATQTSTQVPTRQDGQAPMATAATPTAQPAAGTETPIPLISKVGNHIKVSGVLEGDMAIGKNFDGNNFTDFTLATAELLLEAKATDWARGAFGVEWLNNENKISVKETYVILGDSAEIPVGVQAGRYYLPFGVWGGHTISDPLTKQAFRTRGNAVTFIARQAGFYAEAYGYNGETDDGGDSSLEHYGFTAGYDQERDDFSFHARAGYISSVFDSANLSDSLTAREYEASLTPNFSFDPTRSYLHADYAGGVALTAQASLAGFGLYAEYVMATEDYHMDFLDNGIPGSYDSKPSAWHVELSYGFDVGKYPTTVALSGSGTHDLGGFLPQTQLALFGGIELVKGFFVKAEYLHAIDYDLEDGGNGNEFDSITFRLAYEF